MARLTMPSMFTLARRYIAHRRNMGYVLRWANLLFDFGRFADRVAPRRALTTALALQWATSGPTQRPATHARRLGMVRGFAGYCAALDPRAEVPDVHLLGPSYQRIRPHLFTPRQVGLILRRARALPTRHSPLHPMTYETLIGLLACTGMRPGEARRLQLGDFDAAAALLRIGRCKFSPERMIPLHASTVHALARYRNARRRLFPFAEHLFVGITGRPLRAECTVKVFHRLTLGIAANGQRRSLRLLDFRHTFASQWIARWSRQSKPVSHYLLRLARYLGHQDFKSTWWYVSSDPKVLQTAAKSFLLFHEQSHPLP
jgi:integrase